jgi:hypothetical protein
VIRVASVPASHVYVRHLSDPVGGDGVIRLPDPEPADGRTVPGGWWPPLMLEPGWVSSHHDQFDVFHVHFGFDAIAPRALCEVVDELRTYDKPLVYTVHDLRNPHHREPHDHVRQQGVLIAAADHLITLSAGAAAEIKQRWGRSAQVLPHPHVLGRDHFRARRRESDQFTVGVHVKSLRANMDPLPVIAELAAAVSTLDNAELQIDVHDEIFDPTSHWFAPEVGAAILEHGQRGAVRIEVHPYFTDEQLWTYLSSLSVSVLPYRFGTHSGWLEACYDLGTAVIAPDCGYYGQQRPCRTFGFSEQAFDRRSLHAAVEDAYAHWRASTPAPRACWPGRKAERTMLARTHHTIYHSVLR